MKNRYRLRFFICFLLVSSTFPSFSQGNTNTNILSNSSGSIFTENKGQFVSLEEKTPLNEILFKISSSNGDMYVTTSGVSYVFSIQAGKNEKKVDSSLNPHRPPVQLSPVVNQEKNHYEIERVDINLENARIQKSSAEIFYKPEITRYNYYRKNNLIENVQMIEKVIIHNIYPGIDWVLYINSMGGRAMLKQDFILRPGADTRNIKFRYSDNAKLNVDEAGNIIVKSRMGEISESRPVVYDEETKRPISVKVINQHHKISYDFPEPLIRNSTVIDPDLFWGTALTSDVTGINYNDEAIGSDVRTDSAGNIYVLMTTTKGVSFPTLNPGNGAYYKDFSATPNGAMDIMKFTKGGVLLWSTFFGDGTSGTSVALDPSGNLYAAGIGSATSNIPLLNNGGYFDGTSNYNFITKFSASGQLRWCTYFGDFEMVMSQLLCDSKGNLYVNGVANRINFPFMNPGGGSYQFLGMTNSFISEFSPSNQLIWSTLIDGMAYYNSPQRISVDPSDNLYLMDDSVRMFNLSHQETWSDATVGWPYLEDITTDRQGNVYAVGYGPSSIVKTDPGNGAFIDNSPNPGWSTSFIIKYNPSHQIVWSTSFFNTVMTEVYRIVADQKCDAIHLVGIMNSLPTIVPTVNNTCNGGFYFVPGQNATSYAPIFITFKTSGRLIYCSLTNFPYNYYNQGLAVATDPFGGLIYLFGQIFVYSSIPAVKDPGNGAFIQNGPNNVNLSAFLMKMIPSKMDATISVNTPTGCSCNGSASINVLCGTAPFVYTWNTGENTASINGLCSGNYSVTVTDDNCNDTTFSFTIPPAPGSITGFTSSTVNAHCKQNDGQINISAVQGGTSPYQYSINNQPVQNNGSFNGLTPGNYLITVSDLNGCNYKDSILVVNSIGPDSIFASLTAASCKINDGVILIDSVHGGTSIFQYSLNSGTFDPSTLFPNLAPGNYFIRVRDQAGCIHGDSIRVPISLPASIAQIQTGPAYCGQSDGKLIVQSVVGGMSPFIYSLDGNSYQNSSTFNDLPGGKYGVSIKDFKNCILVDSVIIQKIQGPASELLNISNADCGAAFGSVSVNKVSGGTTPYYYSLDSVNFQGAASFNALSAGNYKLFTKDSAGCVSVEAFQVTASSATPVNIFPADSTVCFGANISFSASPGAGPGLRSYNWNNNSGISSIFNTIVENQEYIILSVTNDSNCISGDTILVKVKNCDSVAATCVHFPNAFSPNNDGVNDMFGAIAHCSITSYKLNIYNRYGELVFTTTDISKKWDGSFRGTNVDVGNYVFTCEYSIGAAKKVMNGFVILLR